MRISDWSSDVCSSDLNSGGMSIGNAPAAPRRQRRQSAQKREKNVGDADQRERQEAALELFLAFAAAQAFALGEAHVLLQCHAQPRGGELGFAIGAAADHATVSRDRKSTRLNSSH